MTEEHPERRRGKCLVIQLPYECEITGCDDLATEPMVVTGSYGECGVAAYCEMHADLWDQSNHHGRLDTADVTTEGSL